MGSLFGSILAATSSMRAFQQGLNIVQTNVVNANTPGYVKQIQTFDPNTFDLSRGLAGGVTLGALVSSRNEYAEQIVRQHLNSLGGADQRSSSMGAIESVFAFGGGAGISGAFDAFFAAASELTVNPNSSPARRGLIDRATQVASAFNKTSTALTAARSNADREINNAVAGINDAVNTIRKLNADVRTNYEVQQDPTFDARLHNALEKLAEYSDITALRAPDGTTSIILAGQTQALIGDHQYEIKASFDGVSAHITNAEGEDISSHFTTGRLGGLLSFRNDTIISYTEQLDTLASNFADRVNSVLNSGVDASGNPPAIPLFSYDAAFGAAKTLAVSPLSPAEIAAADSSAPGGNGTALTLASLVRSKEVNGFTYSEYYGNLVGKFGRELASAKADVETSTALVAQAKSYRAQTSEVSLDEEAAKLVALQKSYEAAAKLVTALGDMTDSILQLMR